MRGHARKALTGLLATAAGLVAAELLTAVTGPNGSPVTAFGAVIIDATPTPVKEFAVRTFGTYDKPLLLGGIALALALLAAAIGHAPRRLALAGAAAFGVAGAAAALSRPAADAVDAAPSAVGAVVAAGVLLALRSVPSSPSAAATTDTASPAPDRPPRLFDRRTFGRAAALTATATALGAGSATAIRQAARRSAATMRASVRLPAPADPAPPLPPGTGPGFYTQNRAFYRVDTALIVPRIDLGTWRLRITGMVDRRRELTFADLLARPLIERDITLNCVSNEVGGPYIGTARWLGVPLAPLLREAGVKPRADQLVARSVDGMTIGTPVQTILDGRDAMLCVGMNGEPLPLDHGFPVRMLTPGLYGYVGACKWLTELELSTFDALDAYWVRRGWAARAPVKTASRIDQPRPFATLTPGPVAIAGVAWAQRRGVEAVEVQVDERPWTTATLRPVPSTDTWVQWTYQWTAAPGLHTLRVRATDRTGSVQPEKRATPFPSGATGWHTVTVTVT